MSDNAVVALETLPHALAPAAFVAHLDALARRGDSLSAMLAIELRQTDRIGALIGAAHAQRLVQRIHQRLGELLQPGDRYCMVSADELWIALYDIAHERFASVTAHQVLRVLAGAADSNEGYIGLHPCVGVAIAPAHGRTSLQLIEAADLARRAAHLDDQAVVGFQPEHMASRADPLLLDELRDAIRGNLITVAYQPQIDLRTGRCSAVEALMRWTRRNGERASPLAVAEVAERTDLLYPLTELVLNTILRQLVSLQNDGIRLRVGVNLSARLVGDNDLPELALQMLDSWNVAPSPVPGAPVSCTKLEKLSPVTVRILATDSVEGQRGRPSRVMRLLGLKAVGSRPARRAKPEAERPCLAANRSIPRHTSACCNMGTSPARALLSAGRSTGAPSTPLFSIFNPSQPRTTAATGLPTGPMPL